MAPGPTQILIIALIILLLFGATRLSEIGKGLGEGIRNFKKGIQDSDDTPPEKDAKKQLPADSAPAADKAEDTNKESA